MRICLNLKLNPLSYPAMRDDFLIPPPAGGEVPIAIGRAGDNKLNSKIKI
jgi:hypothetical protein